MHPFEAAEFSHDNSPFDRLTRREWLAVNGIGGFASGTISGANSRRYHALLVAALPSPYGRMTLLSRVEETVAIGSQKYELSSNRYANGAVYPDGWRYVSEFSVWPVPGWIYRLPGGVTLIKRVYLQRGKNTVFVSYTLRESSEPIVTLTVSPMVCWKSYHAEMKPWSAFPVRRGPEVGGWYVQATPDSPKLRLLLRGAKWAPSCWWNERVLHEREQERGLDCEEDLFCPAQGERDLKVGETVVFIGTIEEDEPGDPTLALAEIVKHQESLIKQAGIAGKGNESATDDDTTTPDLVRAADLFLIRALGARHTVLAGYPWFTDWGRDTMIALPGLCIATRRFDIAADILKDFAGFVSQGMIPNRFPDYGETPDYNTCDATLWFVHACQEYVKASGDEEFKRALTSTIETIIAAHRSGTRFGICMDSQDGLLHAGEWGTQLTWMDAKIADWVVTPRSGKPVEIQGLWINALRIAAEWTGNASYAADADKASASFREKFVRLDGNGLYDVLPDNGPPDAAIRPNQVIAAALPFSPLSPDEIAAVVDVAQRELLTPYGLRTLSPRDSRYCPRYEGGMRERDAAYHQGTVWPWLIGPFVDAYRKVHGTDSDISAFLQPLEESLRDCGLGGIAEVYDGDPPRRANGCPWQAWSVAELLRCRTKIASAS